MIITHGNGQQVIREDELLTILFHLDVVPVGDLSNWETLPLESSIKNNHLVGRGVQDDKGSSMAALFAVKALMAVYQEKAGDILSQPISSGGATFARTMKNCVAFGACFPDTEQTEHQENERMPLKDLEKTMDIYAEAVYRLAGEMQ
ncbi:TPA: M20/M25/M40 family metallo-hydrolase [Streptococcus suis]